MLLLLSATKNLDVLYLTGLLNITKFCLHKEGLGCHNKYDLQALAVNLMWGRYLGTLDFLGVLHQKGK